MSFEYNPTIAKRFMSLYWLRPENGLLTYFKSQCFSHLPPKSPSLDISCGDGLFMLLHLGGELDDKTDYFNATKANEFNHNNQIDIFDTSDPNYFPKVITAPQHQINHGTDWKDNLLAKSAKLNLYENLHLHDNNSVPFPFKENFFEWIYSNSIYWTPNISSVLKDIKRMLTETGKVILGIATPYFVNTLNELENHLEPRAMKILDRDRRNSYKGMNTFEEWNELIENSGLSIDSVSSVYPNRYIMDIWNIGLRPFNHLLVKMADQIDERTYLQIKQEWVEICIDLSSSIANLGPHFEIDQAPYLLYVLKK